MERIKHYTYREALKEVGESTDYKVAKIVSIKKWEEIAKCGEGYYHSIDGCGFCIVHRNRNKSRCQCSSETCPAEEICGSLITPKIMLNRIKKLRV